MKRSHRVLHLAVLGMLATSPVLAQGGSAAQADPDKAVSGGGTLPAGWSAKTDRNAPLTNVKFSKMGEGWHFTLGPAGSPDEPGTTGELGEWRSSRSRT